MTKAQEERFPQLPGVETVDAAVSLPQHRQQEQLNVEPDYAETEGEPA